MKIVLTCEHAGNRVPQEVRAFFTATPAILKSHRGFDYGAKKIAEKLSRELNAPLLNGVFTRLVVDLNRSTTAPDLHAKYLQAPESTKASVVRSIHFPFRMKTQFIVARALKTGAQVLHLSVHSFTPVLRGKARTGCDLGLLFDPRQKFEHSLAIQLRARLNQDLPSLNIRMNYPYKGTGNGHTTELRGSSRYAGIELEFSQAWIKRRERAGDLEKKIAVVAQAILAVTRGYAAKKNTTRLQSGGAP